MNEDKARELAQRFGVRMCDENGETHGEELYCLGLDDIIDMAKVLAQPEQEPVAWLHWLHGPVRLFLNKDEAMMELDRLNRGYPVDKDARQMKPLYTTPPQTNAYDNMLKAIDSMRPAARVIKDKPATWWLDEFEKVVRNLKENNT